MSQQAQQPRKQGSLLMDCRATFLVTLFVLLPAVLSSYAGSRPVKAEHSTMQLHMRQRFIGTRQSSNLLISLPARLLGQEAAHVSRCNKADYSKHISAYCRPSLHPGAYQIKKHADRCMVVSAQSNVATGTVVKIPGSDNEIRWGSALSRELELSNAVDEAIASIMQSLGKDFKPDLALVHASSVHGDEYEDLVPMLRDKLPSLKTVFGCSGFGVVGGSGDGPVEVEGEAAFSLTLGQIPGATVQVLHTLRSSIPGDDATPEDWARFVGVQHDSAKPTSFIVFADPRFAQVRDLVAGLDYAFPDVPKIGSILSSGTRSKSRAMWAWSRNRPAGAAGRTSGSATSRSRAQRGYGLRGGRSRGSSGGALFGNNEEAMAAAVLAVMKPGVDKNSKLASEEPPDIEVISDSSEDRETGPNSISSNVSQVSVQDSGSSAGVGVADKQQQQQERSRNNPLSSNSSKQAGLLGSLGKSISSFLGNAKSEEASTSSTTGNAASSSASTSRNEASTSSTMSPSETAQTLSQSMRKAVAAFQTSVSGQQELERSQATSSPADDSGMFMYGAVVLAIQGDVQLDVITTMGYRAPSPRVWRIASVSQSNNIVSIIPEELAAEDGNKNSQYNLKRSIVISQDDSDDEEDEAQGPEVQALAAVVDMLDALTGQDEGLVEIMSNWEELLDTAVVAVAADNSKPVSELGPDDWELLPLQEIVEEYGVLEVGDPPVLGGGVDLRKGNRIKLMVRDPKGVRQDLQDSLLAYKRRDLAAMLEGRSLPPTFGGLLFTDVDRGMDCYEEPNFESSAAHSYVPAPISGVFGGAQIGPLRSSGRATAILEYAAVVGVLRAATDKGSEAVRIESARRAARIKQQQQQESRASKDSSKTQDGTD